MHSLELTNIDKSRVYRPAMNAWSNDKQRFRPPDIRPIVPIESGRASLSQPLHTGTSAFCRLSLRRHPNKEVVLNCMRRYGDAVTIICDAK